jgi:hypothetical protein
MWQHGHRQSGHGQGDSGHHGDSGHEVAGLAPPLDRWPGRIGDHTVTTGTLGGEGGQSRGDFLPYDQARNVRPGTGCRKRARGAWRASIRHIVRSVRRLAPRSGCPGPRDVEPNVPGTKDWQGIRGPTMRPGRRATRPGPDDAPGARRCARGGGRRARGGGRCARGAPGVRPAAGGGRRAGVRSRAGQQGLHHRRDGVDPERVLCAAGV